MVANVETFQFQAETKRLLDIMIHSLYTNKEIFLRELISNASDAIDRLQFEALTKPELLNGDTFAIRLEADSNSRTLIIRDNGIGMSRDEVIANIGTIAKSGTRELCEKITHSPSQDMVAEFIGQFGVGFYSSFMVADKVILVTRRAGEQTGTRWESAGDGHYTIRDIDFPSCGTSITLHLKPVDPESGIEDYTDRWTLARIVKRYSDFIRYPIIHKDQREEIEASEDGKPDGDGKTTIVVEDKVLNSMRPLWMRPRSEVSDEEYSEFYKQLSHDWAAPLRTITLKAEGRLEYQALLFIPSQAPYDLFYHAAESGLRLYAKNVLIMERCEDLLPRYLRFIKGVVDSADLPLNISRQMLQQERHIAQIRTWLTKKVLDTLEELYEKEYDTYLQFWEQFGRALKEGVSSDYQHKDRIVSLLLFESSRDPEKLTTLKDYVAHMKEDQEAVFYLTGESRSVVETSPHLEAFKAAGYEVLYLVEPVDELVVQSLAEFDGIRLKSVGKGRIKLGSEQEKERTEQELKEQEAGCAELLTFLQNKLDRHIKQVRLSNRLTTSPACLVGEEHDYSPQLERLLQKGKGGGPKQRRVLELNPKHQILLKMQQRFQRNKEEPVLSSYAELLLGYAHLAEGSELPDPVQFNYAVTELMATTL